MANLDGVKVEVWAWILIGETDRGTLARQLALKAESQDFGAVLSGAIALAKEKGGKSKVVRYDDMKEYMSCLTSLLVSVTKESIFRMVGQVLPNFRDLIFGKNQ